MSDHPDSIPTATGPRAGSGGGPRRLPRDRRRRPDVLVLALVGAVLGIVLGIVVGGANAAGDDAADYLQPVVERDDFIALVTALPLDRDLRMLTEMLYDDYAEAIADLTDRLDARAEAVGRDRVSDALAGRVFVEPAELRRMRTAVLETYRAGSVDADRLFRNLVLDVRSVLDGRTAAMLDERLPELRRAVLLHPRRADEMDEAYAGEGVDVAELAAAATAPGGELEGLGIAVETILEGWSQAMDALLPAQLEGQRRGRLDRAVARIERDVAALRALDAADLARWRELYRLNDDAVRRIGAVAGRERGPEAEAVWIARFERASFPWLHRPSLPEREFAWMERFLRDEAVLTQARSAFTPFAGEIATLRAEAAELLRRGRLEFDTILTPDMNPATLDQAAARELYRELLRNSGRRAKLESDTTAALEALLTEKQRKQMRADLAAAVYGRR